VPASRDEVWKALEGVIDPELKRSVVELDMVREVTVEGGRVGVTIALTVPGCPLRASFQEQVERALGPLGLDEVALSFDVMTPEERTTLTTKLRGGVAPRTPGISVDSSTRVLAVASGKGGVGKSSLAANLAAAFSQVGHQTGVLDADVYGFSIPHMLGIDQRPIAVGDGEEKMIVPPVRGDLKVMSIGFFLDENTPVMWRGPMLHRALEQFLSDVHWGDLDTLVVDMPPGTGDVAISLGQLLPRAEAVVVTTPQGAAQQVAVRAAQMARKTNMRLLGVAENMSYLEREDGTREELFGSGGGEALAREVDAPLLGTIPFDPRLGAYADRGEPIVLAEPDAPVSRAIVSLAEAIQATRREEGVGIVKRLPLLSA
jgi:ATP-binding protein involved in chromosome partitioning